MTPILEKPPLYHRRALGLLPTRETPEWLERLIEEFRGQGCVVALDMSGEPWDLIVVDRGRHLSLVWCDEILHGPIYVVQVKHPERPGPLAERMILRRVGMSYGAVPLIATFRPARALRDRWKVERA